MDRKVQLKGKKFLVFGAGLSGTAAAELLLRNGLSVILYEGNEKQTEEEIRGRSPLFGNMRIVLGALPETVIRECEIAVLSPGVPTDLEAVQRMRSMGLAIWGEIELAYMFEQGKILAVTGTNGKTTTTSLLGEIMKYAALAENNVKDMGISKVEVVGNIGIPYTSVVEHTACDSVTVAEISSFQLETVHTFCPHISAILNITPDHLNRHHTMENYQEAKMRIAMNQGKEQVCILNYEDIALREFAPNVKAKVVFFSSKRKLSQGIYLDGEDIVWVMDGEETVVCHTNQLQLIGLHNYENVMAAAAMAIMFGVPIERIREVLQQFTAVAHRIEYVVTKRGVRFYNDSKGTNPDAAIQAIRAMKWPTLLIGGGYDKDSEFEEWIGAFDGKVKKFVLLGATREKIRDTAVRMGYPAKDIILTDSLEEAVQICYDNAVSGDAVLLSPACASWGMFRDYEQRGDMFKEMVKGLEE